MSPSDKALEQALGILGEHFNNYIVIAQSADNKGHFDMEVSCPYATTGLLTEASKWHIAKTQMGGYGQEAIEWVEEEEEEDDSTDEWTDE